MLVLHAMMRMLMLMLLLIYFCIQASLDEVENIEGILELDEEKEVMIISDENEMGQVKTVLKY